MLKIEVEDGEGALAGRMFLLPPKNKPRYAKSVEYDALFVQASRKVLAKNIEELETDDIFRMSRVSCRAATTPWPYVLRALMAAYPDEVVQYVLTTPEILEAVR